MLKNILSLLLSKFYSKQENDTISHLATPTINNPVNVTLATDANSVIVAPFDGYLNIETTAEGNPTINVWEALWCNSTPISPAQAKIFVPVTKGQRIQYMITGTISQARFVRLVGGGYQTLKNSLLQGGVLCRLSHSYSSLRRSSCIVREKKLGVGLIQKAGITTLFTSMVSLRQNRSNIPHLRMELCNLLLEQIHKMSSKSGDLYTILRPVLTWNTQKNGLLLIIELQRDTPSNLLYSHSKQQTLTTSSLFPSTKPAVGGASC